MGAWAALAVLLLGPPAAPPVSAPRYPIEYVVSESAALFHWVDCLAGTSAGKTVSLHRETFVRRFGPLAPADEAALRAFVTIRERHGRAASAGSASLLGIFLEAPERETALARAAAELGEADARRLRGILEAFEPRFRRLWEDGPRAPARYLPRFRDRLADVDLERTLVRAARFLEVDPASLPPARVVLLPVPDGDGTHAQAIGRQLLVEVRPSDRPVDQVAPIVHENVHWLMQSIEPERLARLDRAAMEAGAQGARALALLPEALPTAVAQGAADREHNPADWSLRGPWYHLREVDAYAKAIYPLVQQALDRGRPFDEALLGRMVALTPPAP